MLLGLSSRLTLLEQAKKRGGYDSRRNSYLTQPQIV